MREASSSKKVRGQGAGRTGRVMLAEAQKAGSELGPQCWEKQSSCPGTAGLALAALCLQRGPRAVKALLSEAGIGLKDPKI